MELESSMGGEGHDLGGHQALLGMNHLPLARPRVTAHHPGAPRGAPDLHLAAQQLPQRIRVAEAEAEAMHPAVREGQHHLGR